MHPVIRRLDHVDRYPPDDTNYGIARAMLVHSPKVRLCNAIAPHIFDAEPVDTVLWVPLFEVFPSWAHGMQPTGDCTCWMQKHLVDVLHCVRWKAGQAEKPDARVFGPSIYAFGKCELEGSYGYKGAGSTGYASATACNKFGVLYAKSYSDGKNDFEPDDDLSVAWGDRGAGVPDWLEKFAAQHKLVDRIDVDTPEAAGKLIQAGYPVQYCGYTYWGRNRSSDGLATSVSSGWHAMTATGVRWKGDQVLALWIANTGHGNNCDGPVGPFGMPDIYAQCGSWVPRARLASVYSAGDCYAHTDIEGWPVSQLPNSGAYEYL